jgi:hypothetical protein
VAAELDDVAVGPVVPTRPDGLDEAWDTPGTEADVGVEEDFEDKAWSPNAPTATPTTNTATGMPTRVRGLFGFFGPFFGGAAAPVAAAAGAGWGRAGSTGWGAVAAGS